MFDPRLRPEKLFLESADWSSVRVTPASGTTACVGMILAMNLDLILRRIRARRLSRPLVTTLFANFHVVAQVA